MGQRGEYVVERLYVYQVRYATTIDHIDMDAITVTAPSLLEAVVLARYRVETRTDGFYELLSVTRLRPETDGTAVSPVD